VNGNVKLKQPMDNLTLNYPEMWGNSQAEIQAEFTGIGSKPYRVTSKNPITISRGIEPSGQVGEFGANNTPNKRVGWYKYYMTKNAFNKLVEANKVTLNALLD